MKRESGNAEIRHLLTARELRAQRVQPRLVQRRHRVQPVEGAAEKEEHEHLAAAGLLREGATSPDRQKRASRDQGAVLEEESPVHLISSAARERRAAIPRRARAPDRAEREIGAAPRGWRRA